MGAYLPAGHRPLMASAFMTVLVPKVAGVRAVIACTPPQDAGAGHPAMLYTADDAAPTPCSPSVVFRRSPRWLSGWRDEPVDMIVGAGNV